MISESMKLLRSEVLKLLLMMCVAAGLAYAVVWVTKPLPAAATSVLVLTNIFIPFAP